MDLLLLHREWVEVLEEAEEEDKFQDLRQ